jgi:hypothetical protein
MPPVMRFWVPWGWVISATTSRIRISRYRDICSIDLLIIGLPPGRITHGFVLVNMDATVFAQAPRLSPYKSRMATCEWPIACP